MKITADQKRKKKITLVALAVVLLLVGVAGFAYATHLQSNKDTDSRQPSSSNPADSNSSESTNNAPSSPQDKQEFLDSESGESQPQTPSQNSTEISLEARSEGSNVIVTTNLSSIPSGECLLTVTGGSSTVTKSAQVIYTPQYSTCAGFTVGKAELPSGNWSIKLEVKTNGSTISKTVTHTP